MDFAYSEKTRVLLDRLLAFMDEHIYPNEKLYHEQVAADRWGNPATAWACAASSTRTIG